MSALKCKCKHNIYKEAVQEIERQLMREDTDGAECCLHIRGILNDVSVFESGQKNRMVYLKGDI